MENAGLSAAGSLLGESTVSNLEARTSHLQPRKRHIHLLCAEAGRREAEGVCFALITDSPQQMPCSGFREPEQQRRETEASTRNSRRFEEENECYSCMKSQQQPGWGSLWFCPHLFLTSPSWAEGVGAADTMGVSLNPASGDGRLL